VSEFAADSIVYMRARVASNINETTLGRECAVIEPVDKSGKVIEGAWPYTVPVEWLIPISEMRRIAGRKD
jgi:hypothetical protein